MERKRKATWYPSPDAGSSQSRPERRQRIDIKIEDDEEPEPTARRFPNSAIQPVVAPPRAQLNPEQQRVLDLVNRGENVLYTSPAGCGKSVVTKAIEAMLRDKDKHVDLVAPTGLAALNIGGTTIHSYAGWTPDDERKGIRQLEARAQGRWIRTRLRRTNVLIIDEISMVSNELLERLHYVMVAARDNDAPFGGVQLVICGDFRQLGPVKSWDFCMWCGQPRKVIIENLEYQCTNEDCVSARGVVKEHEKWAFHSEHFSQARLECVLLTKIYRQASDETFMQILSKMWLGKKLTSTEVDLLKNHATRMTMPVKLRPTRKEVSSINSAEFTKLPGNAVRYTSRDEFQWEAHHRSLEKKGQQSKFDHTLIALQDHRYDPVVRLKVGALVMLLRGLDFDNGLVNGSMGFVVGFKEHDLSDLPRPRVRTDRRSHYNDDLMERAVAGLGPAPGADYSLIRYEQTKKFIADAVERNWPVVKFDSGITATIHADCSVTELGDVEPYSLLMRTQIPLILSYAMTIHKSQGQELPEVEVDLSKCFEPGQPYVAMSRARDLPNLKVLGYGKGYACENADEEVSNWQYETFP